MHETGKITEKQGKRGEHEHTWAQVFVHVCQRVLMAWLLYTCSLLFVAGLSLDGERTNKAASSPLAFAA